MIYLLLVGQSISEKNKYNKQFHNLVKKTITLTWLMCDHRDNVIFGNYICNSIFIIEHTMETYQCTILYNQKTKHVSLRQ